MRPPASRVLHCVLLLTAVAARGAATDADPSDDPQPTVDETVILHLINRFRADPAAEAERMKPELFAGVDAAMFVAEMKALKPAPPLVFDLRLLAAARAHDRYMIANGMSHDEAAGKPGFTGASPTDRAKAAGFAEGGCAENIFLMAPSPWGSQVGFVSDFGAGPGGMQPGRGHRTNLINPAYRVIGAGAIPHQGCLAVTHDLANGGATRYVGGVVYVDRNGNGAYDPGEGKGGVVVTCADGSRTLTWDSGAYALPLKSGGAVNLGFIAASDRHAEMLAAGAANLAMDWQVSAKAEDAAADKLIAAAEKDGEDPARLKARIALAVGAESLVLDAERRARVASALGDAGDALAAARTAVRAAFATDPAAYRKAAAEAAKPYKGTAAADWFREAEQAYGAIRAVAAAEADTKRAPAADAELTKQLEALRDACKTAEFRARARALIARLAARAK